MKKTHRRGRWFFIVRLVNVFGYVCGTNCYNLVAIVRWQNKGQNFRNFLGRSSEDLFSKESMRIFKTFWKMSLEEFEKIFQRRF